MTIQDIFYQRSMEVQEKEFLVKNSKSLTLRVDEMDANAADFLASELGTTRQDVMSEIVHKGVNDALVGYAKAHNFSDKEFMNMVASFKPSSEEKGDK